MGPSGSGGSTTINPVTLKDVKPWEQHYLQGYTQFRQDQPLLNAAQTGALNWWNTQLPGLMKGLQQGYADYAKNLPQAYSALQSRITPLMSGLQQGFTQLQNRVNPLFPTLQRAYNQYGQTIQQHGALSPELARDVQQQTRETAGQYGTGRQLGTLGTELLNRQQAREARLAQATGMAQGLSQNIAGLQQGLFGARQGLTQQESGLAGQLFGAKQGVLQGLLSNLSGITGQQSQLNTQGLNNLTGVQGAITQNYVPLMQLSQTFPLANLQAAIQQAMINAQLNTAASSQTSGFISNLISGLGSIVGGIAMSDKELKTMIKPTKLKTPEGIPIKTFEYKTKPGVRYAGVLAQDVEMTMPERVVTDPVSGLKAVLGFPMMEVSPVKRKKA